MTQKTVQPMYIMEVKDKKDWKEPKHSMKTPTPMVLTIAATVPAVFDMPARTPQIPSSFTHTAQKMYISYSNLKYQQSVHNCISSMNRMKLSHFFGSQTVSTIDLLFKESRWVGLARNNFWWKDVVDTFFAWMDVCQNRANSPQFIIFSPLVDHYCFENRRLEYLASKA
jgi:hypothetical protein